MKKTNVYKTKIVSLFENKLFQFVLISFIILFIAILFQSNRQYFDADGYYILSNDFKVIPFLRFDFYAETFRGYFFPWLLSIINFGDILGIHGFVFTLSLFTSFIFSIILPGIFEYAFSTKVKLYQKLVVTSLYLFLFKGLLIYTLTDFYALGFCLISIYIIYKIRKEENPISHQNFYWFIAGATSYMAYNTRTIYSIFILLLVLILIIEGIFNHSKQLIREIFLFLTGMLIVSIPQIIINWTFLDTMSPLLIGNYTGKNIFFFQLQTGLLLEKYETYVGHTISDLQGISFYDNGILSSIPINTINEYIFVVITHPVSYLKLLFSHFFNMIDIRYPDVYIKSFINTTFVQTINYLAISFSLTSLIQKVKDKTERFSKLLYQSRYILVLLLSSLCIVPGAVETRFGVPVLIILWCFGLFNFRFPKKEDSKNSIFIYVLTCLVIFIILFAVSTQTVYPTISTLEQYK